MEWVDRHQEPADTRDSITRWLIEFTRRENIALGIFDRADNSTVLGATGFHNIDWTVPAVEIGYRVIPEVQGQGYVTEAVALLTNFAFAEFDANRISIHCDPRNERSKRVAERLATSLKAGCGTRRVRRTVSARYAGLLVDSGGSAHSAVGNRKRGPYKDAAARVAGPARRKS